MESRFSMMSNTLHLEGTKTDSYYNPTGELADGDVKVLHLTYDVDKWVIEI